MLKIKHLTLLLGLLVALSSAMKMASYSQNRLCYKDGTLNDFTQEFFHYQNWEMLSVTSERKINSELKDFKCNLVEDIKYFKSKSIKEKPIFLYHFPKKVFGHIQNNHRFYLKSLDKENTFKDILSTDFLPQMWYQEYQTIPGKNDKQEEFAVKSFVFVANSQPFLVYNSLGYLETSSKTTYELSQLEQIIQNSNCKLTYQEIIQKIEEMITYTMISSYQKFQQNVKFFSNFEITIKFDKNNWQPLLVEVQALNLVQSSLYSENDKNFKTPKFNFLLDYMQSVYNLELEIMQNFKSFDKLKTQVQKYTENYYILKLLINQENEFFGPLQPKKIAEISQIFPKKYWLCLNNMNAKVLPVKKWVQQHKPNWIVLDDIKRYKYNIQNCDIAYTLEKFPYSQLDFKTQVWNKFKEYKLMHNKGNFYKLLRAYDLKDKYTFNSTTFFPESYLLEYDTPKMTYDEKMFMAKKYQPGDTQQWIYKPVYSSRGRGISIFDSLEEAQKNYQKEKRKTVLKDDSTLKPDNTLQKNRRNLNQYLLQKYIKDTQTLENRKFDIRCYLVFGWSEPGAELVLFNSGKVRRSLHDYVEDGEDEMDSNSQLSQHLTNIALSKKEYKKEKDIFRNQTMTTIQQFRDHLEDKQGLSKQKLDEIFFEMKKILAYTAEAFLSKIPKQPGHFETYGMDIMFDKNWKPFILEANTSPMFNTKDYNDALKDQVYEILGSVMDLETFLVENKPRAKELIKEQTQLPLGHLEVLFNRANGFSILNEFKKNKKQQHIDKKLEKEMDIKFDELNSDDEKENTIDSEMDSNENEIDTDELYTNDCPELDQNCEQQIIIDNQNFTEYCEPIF